MDGRRPSMLDGLGDVEALFPTPVQHNDVLQSLLCSTDTTGQTDPSRGILSTDAVSQVAAIDWTTS